MQPFTPFKARLAPLPEANIDTDIIFPARFLLITAKKGLGRYAFYERRYGADGLEQSQFVLNRPAFLRPEILIAGDNFGCGSSREQAVWALQDLGVRCVISTSFGEIFQSNCFKNGLLPIVVTVDQSARLFGDAEDGVPIEIDLAEMQVRRRNEETIAFLIEPWRRDALLNGWDEIAIVLNEQATAIGAFEDRQRAEKPWLYTGE